MSYNDVDTATQKSAGMVLPPLKDEDRAKAVRVVAGSDACRGAGDAKVLLESLGLYDFAVGLATGQKS